MTATAPTYANDIKPLFRESDRTAMLSAFDLWSFDDVASNSARILAAVDSGSMPCDTRCPTSRLIYSDAGSTAGRRRETDLSTPATGASLSYYDSQPVRSHS